jgi:hypothetical protein
MLPIKIKSSLINNKNVSGGPLPSFIKFMGKSFVIRPTDLKQKGMYKIEVSLEDGFADPNKYKFSFNVDRDPGSKISIKQSGFKVSRAQVKLSQVKRDGKLRMQFFSPLSSSELT